MANPTFQRTGDAAATALTSKAPRENIGPAPGRIVATMMPDVDGAFIQTHGYGPRLITLTGYLEGSAQATPVLAIADLKAAIRTIQALAGEFGTYTGADAVETANAALQAYRTIGVYATYTNAARNYVGIVRVAATIFDAAPS